MNRGALGGAGCVSSAPRSVAAGDLVLVPHNFGFDVRVVVLFTNIVAAGGFKPGDVADVSSGFNDGSGGIGIVRNLGLVRVVIGSSGVAVLDPVGGGAVTASNTNWLCTVKVYPE